MSIVIDKIKDLNSENKVRYNSLPWSLEESVDNIIVLKCKKDEKIITSLKDILLFLKNHQTSYITNISFIDKHKSYFDKYYCDHNLHIIFYQVIQQYINTIDKLYFKREKNITTYILKGYTLLYNIDDFVYVYKNNNDIYIVSEFSIVCTQSWYISFNYLTVKYLYLDNLDVSSMMSLNGFFKGCYNLETVILKNFNTCNVKTLKELFAGCSSLKNIDIDCLNTENVVNFSDMFSMCFNLKKINLNNFNTYKGVNFSSMFFGCENLEYVDMKTCKSNAIENIDNMFKGCSSLRVIYCNDLIPHTRKDLVSRNGITEGCTSLETFNI